MASGRIFPVSRRGFTLVELLLVITILSLALVVILPRLPDLTRLSFERGGRKTALMIRMLRERAVTTRRYYRLEISLADSRLLASYFGPEGVYVEDEQVLPQLLPAPSRFLDVDTAEGGKITGEKAFLHISPRGMVEPSALHLGDGKDRVLTVLPDLLGGGVEIVPGYKELEPR